MALNYCVINATKCVHIVFQVFKFSLSNETEHNFRAISLHLILFWFDLALWPQLCRYNNRIRYTLIACMNGYYLAWAFCFRLYFVYLVLVCFALFISLFLLLLFLLLFRSNQVIESERSQRIFLINLWWSQKICALSFMQTQNRQIIHRTFWCVDAVYGTIDDTISHMEY